MGFPKKKKRGGGGAKKELQGGRIERTGGGVEWGWAGWEWKRGKQGGCSWRFGFFKTKETVKLRVSLPYYYISSRRT